MSGGSVVVAVDVSIGAVRAVEWAVGEAARRSAKLRLIHVVDPADRTVAAATGGRVDSAAVGLVLLAACAHAAHRLDPRVVVDTAVLPAPSASALDVVLAEASSDAELLVVGANGTAGYASSALGSVAERAAVHATCPVVVVAAPSLARSPRRVVVGTTGADSPASAYAQDVSDDLVRIDAASIEAVPGVVAAAESSDLLVLCAEHSDESFSSRLGAVAASVLPLVQCPVVLVHAEPGGR